MDPNAPPEPDNNQPSLLSALDVRDRIALAGLAVFLVSATISGFLVRAWAGFAALALASLLIAAIVGYSAEEDYGESD